MNRKVLGSRHEGDGDKWQEEIRSANPNLILYIMLISNGKRALDPSLHFTASLESSCLPLPLPLSLTYLLMLAILSPVPSLPLLVPPFTPHGMSPLSSIPLLPL